MEIFFSVLFKGCFKFNWDAAFSEFNKSGSKKINIDLPMDWDLQ